ncbi:receptor tyrosine-protein kinase erbB-4-like isoform X2 [Anneissia japonica]|uniref:receptor tyrosine-protein kinase erbB-4-like isoform X2 n=1 Tax=Anneissia japonica TaxID=1529436 RepID=UPI001425A434|nr:receptor tyrosine-protein kinase erbB-4-like isoform X2 [Anneissia japonica]
MYFILMKGLLLLILLGCSRHSLAARQRSNGACTGTNYGRSVVQDPEQRYNILKTLYTNCTYIEGNLEISYQQDTDKDFSFLKDIREVTGYVLISLSHLRYGMMPNLRVIRGTKLLDGNALFISHNYNQENKDIGLHELQFRSLQEIIQGNVTIVSNNRLCFVDTIDWDDIISPGANVTIEYDNTAPQRDCPPCNNSNGGGCWGEGPENYQQLTKRICDGTCDYRCRGNTAADCCHKSCAAGCTGSLNTECLSCRNFTNGNECVESCPPRYVYDPLSYKNIENSKFRYSYGAQCIKECPSNFLTESDTCVKQCDDGKEEKDGICVDCDGPCPKTCEGLQSSETLSAKNYDSLKGGCTIIKFNIIIGVITFLGDPLENIEPLTMKDLEIFRTVKVINGFLSVQAMHPGLTNLSMFENLTEIKGREHYSHLDASLSISGTNLESIGLTSLKSISQGNVILTHNRNLCYNKKNMWNEFFSDSSQEAQFFKTIGSNCSAEGRVCDQQCVDIGCWGPGPEQCVKCQNKKIGNKCVEDCDYANGEYYAGNGTCEFCDEECVGGCFGPGTDKCNQCKHFKDGPFCVPKCPEVKYSNGSGICLPCHENCVKGCKGPENTIGTNGCNACAKVKLDREDNLIECLTGGAFGINKTCDEGYFYERKSFKGSDTATQICQECHSECRNCTAKGSYNCDSCKNFKRKGECVSKCETHEYFNDKFECQNCDHKCKDGCKGPTARDCKSECTQYKIMISEDSFECAAQCSEEFPFQSSPYICVSNCSENMFPNDKNLCRNCHSECMGGCLGDQRKDCLACKNFNHNGECRETCPTGSVEDGNICRKVDLSTTGKSTDTPKSGLSSPLIIGVSFSIVLVMMVVFFIGYAFYKRKYRDNMMDLPTTLAIKQLEHPEENEPLTPSGVAPNQAQLRLINENEMKKMSKLGSGAFGTVFKGVWTPDGEKVRIPIAIKVLQEGLTAKASGELLEEAYVMASVEHPCVLRLLGVCCGQEMMLITQLMPMGALLEFTREHKGRISSQHLLLWSHQIAQGMVYLEDKHIIHRDLAARNVLVLSPNQVKITDFGLAKFLEVEEHEYKSDGGKMPIKWLALECIMYRKFTHKSDVWSFGVTLWELMTFGQKPYERVRARDMPEILERGERLSQPPICTIDVYMLMVKCWLLDPESRPTFKQLSDELDRMAKDPSRYLVIQNDGAQTLPMTSKDDFYKSLLSDGGEADPNLFMDADDYLQPSVCNTDPAYRFPEVDDTFFDENRDYLNDAVTITGVPSSAVCYKPKGFPRTSTTSLRYSQDPTVASHLQRQRSNASNGRNPLPCSEYQPLNHDNNTYQPLIREEVELADDALEEENYQNTPTRGGSVSGPEDYMPLKNGPTMVGMDNMEYHALLQNAPGHWSKPGGMNRQMSTPVQQSPLKYPPVRNTSLGSSQPLLNGQVDYQNLANASSGHQDILSTPKRSSNVSQATSDGYLSEHDYMNSEPPLSPTESTV